MTVTAIATPEVYQLDGQSASFAIPFGFTAEEYVVVTHTTDLGVTTTLALGTDYTISGDEQAGFTVDTVQQLPGGGTLAISRNEPATQIQAFRDNTRFPARQTGDMGDRLARAIQDIKAALDRAIKVPPTEHGTPIDFGSAQARRMWVPSFDTDGNIEYIIRAADLLDIADNLALILLVGQTVPNIDTLSGLAAEIVVLAGIAQDIDDLGGHTDAIVNLNNIRQELLSIEAYLLELNAIGDDLRSGQSVLRVIGDDMNLGGESSVILSSFDNATQANSSAAAARSDVIDFGEHACRHAYQWTEDTGGLPNATADSTAIFDVDNEGVFCLLGGVSNPDFLYAKRLLPLRPSRVYRLTVDLEVMDDASTIPAAQLHFVVLNGNAIPVATLKATAQNIVQADGRVRITARASTDGIIPPESIVLNEADQVFLRFGLEVNPVSQAGIFRCYAVTIEDITFQHELENTASIDQLTLGVIAGANPAYDGIENAGSALNVVGDQLTELAAQVVALASVSPAVTPSISSDLTIENGNTVTSLTIELDITGDVSLLRVRLGTAGTWVTIPNNSTSYTFTSISLTGANTLAERTVSVEVTDAAIGLVGGNVAQIDVVLNFRDAIFWTVEDNDTITGLDSATIRAWDDGGASPYDTGEGDSSLPDSIAQNITTAANATNRWLKLFVPDGYGLPRIAFDGNGKAVLGTDDYTPQTIKNADGVTDVTGQVIRIAVPPAETMVELSE